MNYIIYVTLRIMYVLKTIIFWKIDNYIKIFTNKKKT